MREKEIHQLINEVNILRELKHENIVRCFDKIVDKKQTTLYIVMEYCKGGDLAQLISKCKKMQDLTSVWAWLALQLVLTEQIHPRFRAGDFLVDLQHKRHLHL